MKRPSTGRLTSSLALCSPPRTLRLPQPPGRSEEHRPDGLMCEGKGNGGEAGGRVTAVAADCDKAITDLLAWRGGPTHLHPSESAGGEQIEYMTEDDGGRGFRTGRGLTWWERLIDGQIDRWIDCKSTIWGGSVSVEGLITHKGLFMWRESPQVLAPFFFAHCTRHLNRPDEKVWWC